MTYEEMMHISASLRKEAQENVEDLYNSALWSKINPYISKGETMKGVKWNVGEVTINQCIGEHPIMSVELNGDVFGSFPSMTYDEIRAYIESKLNPSDKMYVCMARGSGKRLYADMWIQQLAMLYGFDTYQPRIKDVIFNDPATIVFWADGTKTVVKCQEGDEFDPEKGLTMAIAKRVYGNKGSYCNRIKKWVEPYYEKQVEIENKKIEEALDALAETAQKILGSIPSFKFNIESKKGDA